MLCCKLSDLLPTIVCEVECLCRTPIIAHINMACVVDNILCFLTNKMNVLTTDVLVKLCVSTYSEVEIKQSKNTLFEMCADGSTTTRNIRRQGDKMNEANVEDMLKLLQEKGDDIPAFVVQDLSKLPPISFDCVDVSAILRKLESTMSEVSMMKEAMRVQAEVSENLGRELAAANSRLQRLERRADLDELRLDGIANYDTTEPEATLMKEVTPGVPVMDFKTALTRNVTGDGWQRVERWKGAHRPPTREQRQQTKKPVGISGKAKTDTLKTIKKPKRMANVFASRFEPDVSAEQVKAYLEEKLNLELNVEKVKTRFDTYSSFHVVCHCDNPEIFMDEELWPERTYVRWWREEKKKQMNSELAQLPSSHGNGDSN